MNKNQILMISGIGVLGAIAITYLLKPKNTDKGDTTFENAGIPDQTKDNDLAQLENAKMVSEGSQFGVQYYNQKISEVEEIT